AKSPAVTVKNDEGTTLVKGTDYTVAYKNNKTVGKGSVVISGKGDYTFTKTLTFKINPKATKLKKVKRAGKGKMKVTWKKQTVSKTPFTGYQVRYSKKSSMADAKYKTVSKKAVTSKKIKTGKGKFYVQVRTYKVVDGERYYSSWSAKKSVKVK
ncbi:MAG: fibronectin type III domain-containing protein, partial [Eubacterium sp.]|nr:fibronectin type III domain-containing protein [Candidatus Colimonas fimequi]